MLVIFCIFLYQDFYVFQHYHISLPNKVVARLIFLQLSQTLMKSLTKTKFTIPETKKRRQGFLKANL